MYAPRIHKYVERSFSQLSLQCSRISLMKKQGIDHGRKCSGALISIQAGSDKVTEWWYHYLWDFSSIALVAGFSDHPSCLVAPSILHTMSWSLGGAVALWPAVLWRPLIVFSFPPCAAWLLSIFTTIAGICCGPCVDRTMKINIAHTLELAATRHPLNKHPVHTNGGVTTVNKRVNSLVYQK